MPSCSYLCTAREGFGVCAGPLWQCAAPIGGGGVVAPCPPLSHISQSVLAQFSFMMFAGMLALAGGGRRCTQHPLSVAGGGGGGWIIQVSHSRGPQRPTRGDCLVPAV